MWIYRLSNYNSCFIYLFSYFFRFSLKPGLYSSTSVHILHTDEATPRDYYKIDNKDLSLEQAAFTLLSGSWHMFKPISMDI